VCTCTSTTSAWVDYEGEREREKDGVGECRGRARKLGSAQNIRCGHTDDVIVACDEACAAMLMTSSFASAD
jgi:hypothetical protein